VVAAALIGLFALSTLGEERARRRDMGFREENNVTICLKSYMLV